MAERLAAALCAMLLAACAARPTHPDAFAFAVFGDTPYGEAEERAYLAMLGRLGREDLAFVVHVGDIKGGGACDDALYERRRAQFDAVAPPFIYTPGDNEWTDCRRNGEDPLERLAALRRVFFAEPRSLGRRRIELSVQARCALPAPGGCACPGLPENRFWSRAGVRFVTLHVVGSNDNVGFDARNDEEAHCRQAANAAWLERAVRASEHSETRALVIFMQANPWEPTEAVYRALRRQMREAQHRLRKPVLLVHGHTHTPRIDTPFTDAMGHAIAGITRLEVHGSPVVGWTRVAVDPDDPQVFAIEQKLEAVAH